MVCPCPLSYGAGREEYNASPSFPATLQKALLVPHTQTVLAGEGVFQGFLQIPSLETLTRLQSAPTEIQQAGQRVLTGVIKMLLHAAITRKSAPVDANAKTAGDGDLAHRLIGELEGGSLRLDTRLTWIVAQKVTQKIPQ